MTSQKARKLENLVEEECTVYKTADGKYLVRTFPKPVEVYEFPKPSRVQGEKHKMKFKSDVSMMLLTAGIGGWGALVAALAGTYIRDSEYFKKEDTVKISEQISDRINPGSANITYHPEPKKVYPPLSTVEGSELDSLVGNRKAVQEFINKQVDQTNFLLDEVQFNGSLCEQDAVCDVWVPAVHFYRVKNGDCDDAMAFAHYLLRDGVGLYLSSDDERNKDEHIVYVHEENGKYSIISRNKVEQTEAKFQSIEDAANFLRATRDYYQIAKLPDNSEKLLYEFDIKKDVIWGPKVYFSKDVKKTEMGNDPI